MDTQSDVSSSQASPVAGLPPELERYRRHIAHLNLPTEREAAMILAVWGMMASFVDRAFGHDPVQLAQNAGDASRIPREDKSLPVIELQPIHTETHTYLSDAFGESAEGVGRKKAIKP